MATKVRTGIGVDIHAFAENRKLTIGGVDIPYPKGLQGHSDADVLVHAIMDAILGASSLPDIGSCFPDDREEFKNANSLEMLSTVVRNSRDKGYEIIFIDSVLIAQKPRFAQYISEMKQRISDTCGLETSDVNVKATTSEYLGFTGREEGIAAIAIVTAEKVGYKTASRVAQIDVQDNVNDEIDMPATIYDHAPGGDPKDIELSEMLKSLERIVCYTDGSSLGNPGHAGCSAVIGDEAGVPLISFRWYIGRHTNNIAEYEAIRNLLAWLDDLAIGSKDIEIRSDSELVVKQLSGLYKVKSESLRPIWLECSRLAAGFKSLKFQHIDREYNKLADKLAREASARKKR